MIGREQKPGWGVTDTARVRVIVTAGGLTPLVREGSRAGHGIDVQAAQALWRDPALLEIPARTSDESRFLVIACLDGRQWSAVITYRQQAIRLISVRRSRPERGASTSISRSGWSNSSTRKPHAWV